jgi:hypothetical protein
MKLYEVPRNSKIKLEDGKAVLDEREAFARVCEEHMKTGPWRMAAMQCAEDIRARGEKA